MTCLIIKCKEIVIKTKKRYRLCYLGIILGSPKIAAAKKKNDIRSHITELKSKKKNRQLFK